MGTKNISISEEAYERLSALKKSNESFTEVINRLTEKRSILELAGVLTEREGRELNETLSTLHGRSSERITSTIRKVE
jgi:predicted CopG family antitoxin